MRLLFKSTAILSIVLFQFSHNLLASPTEIEQSADRNQVPVGMICAPAPAPDRTDEAKGFSSHAHSGSSFRDDRGTTLVNIQHFHP